MGMYQGVNASEGIGIGTVMVAVDPDLTFEPHEVADSAAEKERYQSALSVFCEKTQAQADHMKETVGEAEAEIMSGHIVLAQDPGMTDAINAAIDGGTCAEQALMDTSTMFENMFLSMDDEMFRLRAADIADIRTGILAELLGKEVVDLSVLPENTVVVVHDLTPSMTATIDKAHVAGIVTETGGRTSHSAIIARALEIPAVLSVSNSCTALRNGMTVVVDGGKGIVEADPDEETLAAYTAKAEAFAAEKAALEAFRGKPSVTADGIKKIIACNIGNPDDVPNVGYVTLSCGCRAGLAGQFYCAPGQSAVLQELRSVNIRVARNREFPLPQKLRDILQQRFIGMLLMGEPDSGKTTLLRGVARELAKQNRAVAVIDERREIFPSEESAALPLDILSGIPKGQAVQMALRTLSPQVILLDELGGMDELYALEQGLFSGVEFIATLHAASWEEAARRPQVQYLQKCGALHVAVLLKGRTAPGQLKEVRVS